VKKLREDFLGALQAFGFAALPMNDRVSVVEALDAGPCKGADFYGVAGHHSHLTVCCVLYSKPGPGVILTIRHVNRPDNSDRSPR
jgi:hypothetical protein